MQIWAITTVEIVRINIHDVCLYRKLVCIAEDNY